MAGGLSSAGIHGDDTLHDTSSPDLLTAVHRSKEASTRFLTHIVQGKPVCRCCRGGRLFGLRAGGGTDKTLRLPGKQRMRMLLLLTEM